MIEAGPVLVIDRFDRACTVVGDTAVPSTVPTVGVSAKTVAVLVRFGTHICASVRPRICWKSGQTRTTMVSVRVTPGSVRPPGVPPAAFQTAKTVPLAPTAGVVNVAPGEATAEMKTVPRGSGSLILKFSAALGPGLVAEIVKVSRLPAMTGS